MFISKNEINNFTFRDAVIKKFTVSENEIQLIVEALIVEPHNSQNTNFTKSYADETLITFIGGTLEKAVKDGYKYYDANGVLLKEIPDEDVNAADISTLIRSLEGAYLYDMQEMKPGETTIATSDITSSAGNDISGNTTSEVSNTAALGIELPTDDITGADAISYQFKISYKDVTFEWARYLNRVQE